MWETVEEFAQWYRDNGFPLRPPFEDPVYVTDISYSYVLFREGQFQVELYLIKPNSGSGEHSHPGVENIIIPLGGDLWPSQAGWTPDMTDVLKHPSAEGTSLQFGSISPKFTPEMTHALSVKERGGAVLSVEKWPDGVKPSSLSIVWEGEPVGEVHSTIIQK